MGKSSDRIFHLTVTVFALGLTAVSAVTLAYQHNPERVRSWMTSIVRTPPAPPVINQAGQAGPPAGSTAQNQTGQNGARGVTPVATPAPQTTGDKTGVNQPTFDIRRVGNDVSDADAARVQTLMNQYRMPAVISDALSIRLKRPIHLYLAQSAADYKEALKSLGVSPAQAQRFSRDTGGFTQDDAIVIPLYQNKTTADLANTLAHELTHVYLNAGVAPGLPSWVNEGLAVTLGMHFQQAVAGPLAYDGYAKQMAESVLDAVRDGKLIPLTDDETKVLEGSTDYDLELQDWLAVSWLVQQHGWPAWAAYLNRLNAGMTDGDAFAQTFGVSESVYNDKFTALLRQAVQQADGGVQVTLEVPGDFHGYARVLQHGTQTWTGFELTKGTNTFTVTPSGQLVGQRTTEPATDPNPPDKVTLYIDLDPTTDLTYNGKPVDNSGFAIDYHYGMYAFVNAWVTYEDGKSVYLQDPDLFGVKLTALKEKTPPVLQPLLSVSVPGS
ncbi:hypothetical protein [Alicyclobacillus sp.]|uniref:hypothetical protein n=1 Tax=Alicyclobacillus sp. TaxID=61169 RepID=UPI0025C07E50|nr:hypothetical protein [Alicyclobacillus sp.]MCL6516707.1 hypothetical protein [Alicyclobacillus sp.]